MMVFMVLAALVGLLLGYQVVRVWLVLTLEKLIQSEWQATAGRVDEFCLLTPVGTKVKRPQKGGGSPCSAINARITYEVEKKSYTTSHVSVWSFLGHSNYSSDVSERLRQSVEGSGHVTVYFNPNNPGNAVVDPVAGWRVWYDSTVHAGVAVVGCVLLYMYGGFTGGMWLNSAKMIAYGAAGGVALGGVVIWKVIRRLQ